MTKDSLRQWLGTGALVLIAITLLMFVLAYGGPMVPRGAIGIRSGTNYSSVQVDDGSASEAAFGFTNDPDTGIYRVGANDVGVTVGGSKVLDCASSGCATTLTTAAQPNITSFGTVPTATITNLTTTNVTGTVKTVNQPNITNLGTQTYFTATNSTVTSGTVTTETVTSLVLNGAAFSGPTKYGTAANYTSGSSITHGFTTTPTVCLINPVQNITATYTITNTGFSSNMQTTSSSIYWFCGQ